MDTPVIETWSAKVPTPSHVPPEAVFDFDMYLDYALLEDPHARVRDLLNTAPPVFWTPRNSGHWVVIGHQENYLVSRDTQTFSSSAPAAYAAAMLAQLPPNQGHIPLPTPINMDPPVHTKYRLPLQSAFSPKAMMARKDKVRALAMS